MCTVSSAVLGTLSVLNEGRWCGDGDVDDNKENLTVSFKKKKKDLIMPSPLRISMTLAVPNPVFIF